MAISGRVKVLGGLILFLLVVVGFGANALWLGTSNTLERELKRLTGPAPDVQADTGPLPEPVERFFLHTMPPGQKWIKTAKIHQAGEFLLNGTWRPFTAQQFFTATPPAFMWDARISIAPLMSVYVRDAYIAGGASMRARVMGIYPVVDQANTPELESGALMRYLAEAAWLPTRLKPGSGVSWTPIDDRHAEATLTDDGTTVSLRFTFDAAGAITEIYSPERYREVNGSYVKTPWRVRALGQDSKDGIRVMSPAEVEWVLPEGPQPYWRGRLTAIEYGY